GQYLTSYSTELSPRFLMRTTGVIFCETLSASRTASLTTWIVFAGESVNSVLKKTSRAFKFSRGQTSIASLAAVLLLISTTWLEKVRILIARQVISSTTPV